eukprot:5658774-Amphidinium_carterae.2
MARKRVAWSSPEARVVTIVRSRNLLAATNRTGGQTALPPQQPPQLSAFGKPPPRLARPSSANTSSLYLEENS